METVETRVLKSRFSGMKGAKKERKLLEKSSISYLGSGGCEFESRHSGQNPQECCSWGLIHYTSTFLCIISNSSLTDCEILKNVLDFFDFYFTFVKFIISDQMPAHSPRRSTDTGTRGRYTGPDGIHYPQSTAAPTNGSRPNGLPWHWHGF